MIEDHIIAGFMELFEGRGDVVFVDDGERVRQDKIDTTKWDQVPWDMFKRHLEGGEGIGIYPLRNGRECRWLCSDLDSKDSLDQASALVQAWQFYGIQAWVELSKSKGCHVWVFLDDWTSGTIARRAALYIHQMAGVPADEVNPKQEITDGYGNCVRLPYWHMWMNPGERIVTGLPGIGQRGKTCVIKNFPQTSSAGGHTSLHFHELDEFVELALETRCDPDLLFPLANRWVEPENRRPPRTEAGEWDGTTRDGYYQIREVWHGREDIPKGSRDNLFFACANYAYGIGVPYAEAREVFYEMWDTQTEEKESYPLEFALRKLDRVYNKRNDYWRDLKVEKTIMHGRNK